MLYYLSSSIRMGAMYAIHSRMAPILDRSQRVQVALAWPTEDFSTAAKAALEGGSVELSSLQALAKVKRIALPIS